MRALLLKQNPQLEIRSGAFAGPAPVSGGQIFEPNFIRRSPCPCGGGCPTCRNERGAGEIPFNIQKKSLEISSPSDADEIEADTVARKIVDGERAEIHDTGPAIGRKGKETAEIAPGFQAGLETHKGGGRSLDDSTRTEMESRMGADLGSVKIHTDGAAHDLNKSVNARAFTHGQDIFFRQGEFDPGSKRGKELLAHELVHTVQQGGGTNGRGHANAPLSKLQRSPGPGDDPLNTNEPSPWVLELLAFYSTNRNDKFVHLDAGLFEQESHDRDAIVETIPVKKGGNYWTYEFIQNKKTGFVYVKQSQDGVGITSYWVSKTPHEPTPAPESKVPESKDSEPNVPEPNVPEPDVPEPKVPEPTRPSKPKLPAKSKLHSFGRITTYEIKFIPSTFDYENESNVIKTLAPLAKFLKDNPRVKITIAGNVKAGVPAGNLGNSPAVLAETMPIRINGRTEMWTLSAAMIARARRVIKTLKDLGVTNVMTPATGNKIVGDEGLKIIVTIKQ
jgi:hypothetical protein